MHLSRIIGIAVSALILSALAISGSGGDSIDGGSNDGRGPITFATGKDASGQLRRAIDIWNGRHPDEKVTILELSVLADEQRISMAQNFQARSSRYDVINAEPMWTAEFAARGWVEELDEKRFAKPGILPVPANSARFDGKLYGAAYLTDAALLYYRSDLVKSPPKTWAELKHLCQTIAKQNEIGCYAGQFAQYEGLTVNIFEAVASAGGSFVSDDGRQVTTDTEETRAGLRVLVEGFEEGWIPPAAITYKEEDGRRAFQQGRLLFFRSWPYVYDLANIAGPDSVVSGKFGVAPLPGSAGIGRSVIGGRNLMLSKFSKHKASAKDWMDFMQSEEAQVELVTPVLARLYDDPELRRRKPYFPALKEAILGAVIRPSTPNYNAVTLVIQKNAYAALHRNKTVDQAIADMTSELRQAIKSRY